MSLACKVILASPLFGCLGVIVYYLAITRARAMAIESKHDRMQP